MKGRHMSRKMKNEVSKTLGERAKKQRDTPRTLQAGYSEAHATTLE
jgi:hypothetical protein